MRRQEILLWHDELVKVFGRPRHPIDQPELREAYSKKEYGRMISFIKKSFQLDMRLRVGYVNSGGANAPAWISLPDPMPFYASKEFRQLQVTFYLRRGFINDASFDHLVAVIAHEMSHVLLDSVGHSLRRKEEAVDLTAMLFGYSQFFSPISSVHVEWERSQAEGIWSAIKSMFTGGERPSLTLLKKETFVGYLSPEEILFAQSLMK